MGHQARRLVHDEQVIVLVDDIERDGLGRGASGHRIGHVELHHGAGGEHIAGTHEHAIAGDPAIGDEPLHLGARDPRRIRHELVGTTRRSGLGHLEPDHRAHG
jgi:hypothetical protein